MSSGIEASSPSTAATRVLVVDDEQLVRNFVTTVLTRHDIEAIKACNAGEALALFDAGEQFDLALLDVIMPGLNGYELAGRLAKLQPTLEVVLMSGYAAQISAGGAQVVVPEPRPPVLQKPFTATELIDAIDSALHRGDSDSPTD